MIPTLHVTNSPHIVLTCNAIILDKANEVDLTILFIRTDVCVLVNKSFWYFIRLNAGYCLLEINRSEATFQ